MTTALASGDKTIVLADGTYGGSTYFNDPSASSLYAQHLGGAVFTAGLLVGAGGGSGGAVIQGLAFNVTDPSTTYSGAEVMIWGPGGTNTRVLDSTFNGNWALSSGLNDVDPAGLVAERLQFSSFTDVALRASDNVTVSYGGSVPVINTITDISINGVSRSTPGASNGTGESGLWVGEPVANGVHRIRVRNCAWSAIETVNNSWNTTFSDLDLDMSGPYAVTGIAVYLEHFSINDTFTNFSITGSKEGFNAEWDDGITGNAAASGVTIENGTIDADGWTKPGNTGGVYLDEGTSSTTVTNVLFKNQNWAAIGAYRTTGTNVFSGNTYQLAPGAGSLSPNHI